VCSPTTECATERPACTSTCRYARAGTRRTRLESERMNILDSGRAPLTVALVSYSELCLKQPDCTTSPLRHDLCADHSQRRSPPDRARARCRLFVGHPNPEHRPGSRQRAAGSSGADSGKCGDPAAVVRGAQVCDLHALHRVQRPWTSSGPRVWPSVSAARNVRGALRYAQIDR
jgi:hypothetical protein